MSYVSAVEIYKQTGADPDTHLLFPITSNLEGPYEGSFLIDFSLSFLINTYRQTESDKKLSLVYDSDDWAKVKDVYSDTNPKDAVAPEMLEYGLLKCSEYGYLEVTYYDDIRYFRLKEKCLDLELYKPRKEF